jgi:hypothetical protein
MLSFGMTPQHLLLYEKRIFISLGDELEVVDYLGNYPIAHNPNKFLATFYFLQILWAYVGCNGAASLCTWAEFSPFFEPLD